MENRQLDIKTTAIGQDYHVHWNRKLGSGISGPVRICTSKATGEHYALKCLHDRPKARTEVTCHYRCSGHPHIVTVVDVYANDIVPPGEYASKAYLLMVMELMEGGELFERIRKKVSFTEKEASEITMQITSALAHIHCYNIAHRDLKPENLLLKDKGETVHVKLADFGFAKEDKGDLMTPQFTPYYVSPQVLEAQKYHRAQKLGQVPAGSQPYTYDKSCDMWSLGVIVYIMLCGYPPFYSENPRKQLSQGMRRRIMAGEYDFPSPEWGKVSDQAKDVVKKLLSVNPSERLTVQELMQHPWLSSGKAPNVPLQSPKHMMDEEAFEEAMNAHAAMLTDMRLPENNIALKPMAINANPIVQKRRQAHGNADSEVGGASSLQKPPEVDKALQTLRDVIAVCYMPPKHEKGETDITALGAILKDLVAEAIRQNSSSFPFLTEIFIRESWNGKEFTGPVNRMRLASKLSQLLISREHLSC